MVWTHGVMTLFPSLSVLQQLADVCHVTTDIVVACCDRHSVECRKHVWEGRRQLVLCAGIYNGTWAIWAIKALTPRLERR